MPARVLAVQRTCFPNGNTVIHDHGMAKPPVRCMKAEINQALREHVNVDLLRKRQLLGLNRFKS